ncbi:MAG: hypothetical protein AAF495_24475 [Pseudomonadota bacterium]
MIHHLALRPLLMAIAALSLLTGSAAAQQGAPTAGGQTLRLQAVIAQGAKPLTEPVSYKIYRLEPVVNSGLVLEFFGATTEMVLPSGRYRLITEFGHTKVFEDFELNGEPRDHVVNLNAGRINMRAIPQPGGAVVKKDLRWEIHSFGKDASGKRVLLAQSRHSLSQFVLPVGFYVATAHVANRQVRHTVEVNPGVTYDYTVVLN